MFKYKENDFYQPEKIIEAKLKCQNYQDFFNLMIELINRSSTSSL